MALEQTDQPQGRYLPSDDSKGNSRNARSMVRSPDGDTDFFDITAGVLQGDTLAPYLFIIWLDYVLRKALDENSELGFTLTERRSRRHPAQKFTDADYADDIAVVG
ncbi:hypothetical protein AC249_AIPGENE26468 [Exaiptasia diaphana]|nr:hypothetical protein AC249_AIPGENE26468 [Exaiptasia diaphana]